MFTNQGEMYANPEIREDEIYIKHWEELMNFTTNSLTFGFIEKMEIIFIDWYVTKDKFLIKFYGEDTIDIIKIAEYDKDLRDWVDVEDENNI